MNRYRVILRSDEFFFVNAEGFEIRDGFLVLCQTNSDVSLVPVPELRAVTLVLEMDGETKP